MIGVFLITILYLLTLNWVIVMFAQYFLVFMLIVSIGRINYAALLHSISMKDKFTSRKYSK